MTSSARILSGVRAALTCVALAGAVCTCGKDSTKPQVPVAIAKVSGDAQTGAAHQALAQPLVVKVVDASGGGVPGLAVIWTTTYPGGSDLDTSTTNADGLAQLVVTLDTLAGSYTITAASAALAPVTFTLTCTPGPAAKLVYLVQPSNVVVLAPISPAIQVAVRDQWGNPVTTSSMSIQIWITSGTGAAGATLSGANIKAAVQGVATFTDLSIDKVATGYTLAALSAGVAGAWSTPFNVGPGVATGLAFSPLRPSDGTAGSPVLAVAVEIVDRLGNLVSSAQDSVTVRITAGAGPSGATLSGIAIQRASGGVAVFSGLSLDKAGDYGLTATARGLDSATSAAFHVGPAAAAALSFLDQPTAVTAWDTISPTVRVTVLDRFGNLTDSATNVSMGIATGAGTPGATLLGTLVRPAADGYASFGDLSVDKAGPGYRLAASGPGLSGTTSDSFTVKPAPPRLVFVGQPGSASVNSTIAPAVEVAVQDRGGHTLTDSMSSVTLAITPGTGAPGAILDGTTTRIPVAGVATFDDLKVDRIGIGYTLSATASGIPVALSDSFVVGGTATQIAMGWYHACAIAATGQTYCFGMNDAGQLGGGQVDVGWAEVAGGLSFSQVALGYWHTCGLVGAGSAYCWGDDFFLSRLGDGGSVSSSSPVSVAGGHTFHEIAANVDHTCALDAGGQAYCWGFGWQGQLGTGDSADINVPTPVAGGIAFVHLVAGHLFSCGLTAQGQAYCWGDNSSGQLGDSSATMRRTPVPVAGGMAFTALASGSDHVCGLTSLGGTYCWGKNDGGQLGVGDTLNRAYPVAASTPVAFFALTGGGRHTCGFTATGAAYCWGANESGQLGDGTWVSRTRPVAVSGGLLFAQVRAGASTTCGLTSAGRVYCWGYNFFGRILNSGTTYNPAPSRLAVF